MADKRSLVTSRLLTQQDSEEQKKKINDNNSELEVKDFFPSVLVSYEKKKRFKEIFQSVGTKCNCVDKRNY